MGIGLEVWFGYMIGLPGFSLFLRYVRSLVPPAADCLHTLYADSRTAFSFIEPVD